MVSCFLQGGLGNQMFQISATVSFALKHNISYGINLDDCYTPNQGFTSNKYSNSIFKNLKTTDKKFYTNTYYEPNFSFNEIPYSDDLQLKGYFQSEKYFKEYKNEIKNLFYFSEKDKMTIHNFFKTNKIGDKKLSISA
jgi:hypothetical protein